MKNTFLENMRVDILGRVPGLDPVASFKFNQLDDGTAPAPKTEAKFRASVELCFDKIAPSSEEDIVRQEATAVFCEILYGNIKRQIFLARVEMHRGNISQADKILGDIVTSV